MLRIDALITVVAALATTLGCNRVLGDAAAPHSLMTAGKRWSDARIALERPSLAELRLVGLRVFATPYLRRDGFGEQFEPGSERRPTLGSNGTYLRVDGLDAQTCAECHHAASMATVPLTPGIGGTAGISSSPMLSPTAIDVSGDITGVAGHFNGRLINPLSLFGVGAVQLLAMEMSDRLQRLKARALARPGRWLRLRAAGVDFGSVKADVDGRLDTSRVEGVDADLEIRPFGRKGAFLTVRDFALEALQFHHGMQATELVGEDFDADGDGVANEILDGEVSALTVFLATQETPAMRMTGAIQVRNLRRGFREFKLAGCARCHRPSMRTQGTMLAFPAAQLPVDKGEYLRARYVVDLRDPPARVPPSARGGLVVRLFSDLKRHDMGAELAENLHSASDRRNREFITAKLWGVADTGPYLHDGRALTLHDAIVAHGGEALGARDAFVALSSRRQQYLLDFLHSLKNPTTPNSEAIRKLRALDVARR